MKNKILLISALLLQNIVNAQQVPTGSPVPTTGYTTAQQAASAWYRGGNNSGNTPGLANKFGTNWNSPIYFITGGNTSPFYRMKLNGVFTSIPQYTINNYTSAQGVNTTGYMLIGQNNNSISNGSSIYNNKGAFSLLHLNGEGNAYQEYGYRPWMKTGITFTGNRDLSYFGLRKLATNPNIQDLTETVIMWSDNSGTAEGPDKLVFRFSGVQGLNANFVDTNFLSDTDLDGLHVAQFTGTGRMALGNSFGTNAQGMNVGYIDPINT